MHTRPDLIAADVSRLLLAARTEAEQLGLEVSIALMDGTGVWPQSDDPTVEGRLTSEVPCCWKGEEVVTRHPESMT